MTTGHSGHAYERVTCSEAEPLTTAPHILIVEEQPVIQELLCWVLHLAGYRSTVCTSRQTALTWREQAMMPGSDPVALLLDLSLLGVIEATDFLHLLRAHWREAGGTPPAVIVLTTSKQMQVTLGMREHVLQKPFHVRDLLALIRQVIPVTSRCSQPSP